MLVGGEQWFCQLWVALELTLCLLARDETRKIKAARDRELETMQVSSTVVCTSLLLDLSASPDSVPRG